MRPTAEREAERVREQIRLDAERDQLSRNRAGQFATPPALAADVTAAALKYLPGGEPIHFLEPSVGSGAFVSALLGHPAASRVERMLGVETDPRFAAVAARLWGPAGLRVGVADFTSAPPGQFNLILANPPYVRHHHLDREAKQRLQQRSSEVAGERVSGLSGLYAHFLLHADAWLRPDGVAAWLIPSEFLDVNYGRAVRRYLSQRVDLLRIHRFAATALQFGDALVSSAVVMYRKARPSRRPVDFTSGPTLAAPAQSVMVGRDCLDPVAKWGQLFSGSHMPTEGGVRLGDLFTVRRGLATGANGFFILSRVAAAAHNLPPEFLRPILPSPRHVTGDRIEAAADGLPKVSPELVLLDCRLPEQEVIDRHPKLWAYLQDGVKSGVSAGYLCSRRSPWYAQEDRPPAPFLVPYMGRGRGGDVPFRFLRNASRATAPNVYLMLYPRGPLARRFADDPSSFDAVHAALVRIGGRAVATGGRTYGGGLHKVEPNELSALPAAAVLKAVWGLGIDRNLFDGIDSAGG